MELANLTYPQPMYGMPQPNQYGQYGFGAYGAFPNQGAAAPGAAGAGSPGMPQPVGAAGTGLGISAGAQQPDPNAAAAGQVGQAQWGGADPSSYYSNYWGGQSFHFFPIVMEHRFNTLVSGYYGQAAGQQAGGDVQMQGPSA